MEMSRICIFLKQLSAKMRDFDAVESYREVLAEVLREGNRFYSYNFNEETVQLMNIYLEEEPL